MNLILQAIKSAINGVYTYINKNRLAWTDESETPLIEEHTVSIEASHNYNGKVYGYEQLEGSLYLKEGQDYAVVINGQTYRCTAWYSEDWESTCIGNGSICGTEGGGDEPFFIDSYDEGDIYLEVAQSGDYSISIAEITSEIHKLDPKYIPSDDILIQSSWTEKDNKSKAFILDKPPVIQNEDGEVCIGSPDDIENAERIITEKNFYEPKNHVVIADEVNGYNYIVAMHNGNLVSYVETQSISITRQPTKTSYIKKEAFNPAGMVVIATAKDGSTREITNYEYDILTTENVNRFYIRLEEGTNVFTAKVNNLTIHDFSLEDFEYIANEDGTYELTAWKGTYNGEPSTRIVIPNSELIIV